MAFVLIKIATRGDEILARQDIGGLIKSEPHNKNYAELFNKVYQLSGSLNPLEPVNTFNDLTVAYPNPVEGDSVYVIDDKIIYRWSHKDEKWQYYSDFTILNDVIDDVNNVRDSAIQATNNVNTAIDNANTATTNANAKINEMNTLRDTLNSEESIRITKESERQTNEANRQTDTAIAITHTESATAEANNAASAANAAADNAYIAASNAINIATNLEAAYAPRLTNVENKLIEHDGHVSNIMMHRQIFIGESYPTSIEEGMMNNGDIWFVIKTPFPITTGLKLYLDYEEDIIARSAGVDSYVEQWGDSSGNNRHFKQLVASDQPRLTSNGVLSETSRHVLNCSDLNLFRNIPSATVIVVYEVVSYINNGWVFAATHSGGGALALQRHSNSKYGTLAKRKAADSSVEALSSGNVTAGQRKIVTSEFKWTENTIGQYINGSLDGTASLAQNSEPTEDLSSVDGLWLFNSSGWDRPTNVYITDVAVFIPALSNEDRITVEEYLANKRGISL